MSYLATVQGVTPDSPPTESARVLAFLFYRDSPATSWSLMLRSVSYSAEGWRASPSSPLVEGVEYRLACWFTDDQPGEILRIRQDDANKAPVVAGAV